MYLLCLLFSPSPPPSPSCLDFSSNTFPSVSIVTKRFASAAAKSLFAPLPENETSDSPDNSHNYSMNQQARVIKGRRNARSDRWGCSASPKPVKESRVRRVKGVQPLGVAGEDGVRREKPRGGVLRPAWEQDTKGLHPWLVMILAWSNIQSIPSVPFCHR